MKNNIIISTVVLIFSLIHFSECSTKCNNVELEKPIVKIVGYLSDPRYRLPEKDSEIAQFCRNNDEGTKILREYSTKCLRGVAKTITSVFAYSSVRSNKRFCTKPSLKAKEEIIKSGKCVNPNKKTVQNCYKGFINKLNLTQTIIDSKNRIPYVCCLSVQLKSCVIKELENSNHPQCIAEVVQSYGDYFDSISSNIMNSVCDGSEENSDRCEKILKLPKGKLTKVNFKTPFPIMISIFENL